MSVEKSFEAWEEVQRHGQDFADRLAQGFSGLMQTHLSPPALAWPNPPKSKLFDIEFPTQKFGIRDFGLVPYHYGVNGVSAIFDIGGRIGQAGAEFGACLNGMVDQIIMRLPVPSRHKETVISSIKYDGKEGVRNGSGTSLQGGLGPLTERLRDFGLAENDASSDASIDEDVGGLSLSSVGLLGRQQQGTVNLTSTYDSRTGETESSLVAKGDLWRVEASSRSSSTGIHNPSHFVVQLGPILFVRDTTLLLPVHLSKQHLLWYGYDQKDV